MVLKKRRRRRRIRKRRRGRESRRRRKWRRRSRCSRKRRRRRKRDGDRQAGRQADRQTAGWPAGRPGRQTDRQTDRRVDGRPDQQTDERKARQTDRRTEGQTNRQTNGRPDRQTDRDGDRASLDPQLHLLHTVDIRQQPQAQENLDKDTTTKDDRTQKIIPTTSRASQRRQSPLFSMHCPWPLWTDNDANYEPALSALPMNQADLPLSRLPEASQPVSYWCLTPSKPASQPASVRRRGRERTREGLAVTTALSSDRLVHLAFFTTLLGHRRSSHRNVTA